MSSCLSDVEDFFGVLPRRAGRSPSSNSAGKSPLHCRRRSNESHFVLKPLIVGQKSASNGSPLCGGTACDGQNRERVRCRSYSSAPPRV